MRPGLVLRFFLRPIFWLAHFAELVDRIFFTGGTKTLAKIPRALGEVLSRVQCGSLTEYLLLIFTGLALLVVARLFS